MAGGGIRSLRRLRLRVGRGCYDGVSPGERPDNGRMNCGGGMAREIWKCDCIYTTAFHVFCFLFCFCWFGLGTSCRLVWYQQRFFHVILLAFGTATELQGTCE